MPLEARRVLFACLGALLLLISSYHFLDTFGQYVLFPGFLASALLHIGPHSYWVEVAMVVIDFALYVVLFYLAQLFLQRRGRREDRVGMSLQSVSYAKREVNLSEFILKQPNTSKILEILREVAPRFLVSEEYRELEGDDRIVPWRVCAAFARYVAELQRSISDVNASVNTRTELDQCYEAIEGLASEDGLEISPIPLLSMSAGWRNPSPSMVKQRYPGTGRSEKIGDTRARTVCKFGVQALAWLPNY